METRLKIFFKKAFLLSLCISSALGVVEATEVISEVSDLGKCRSFVFIRHGQTPWGPDDILKGPQDLSLNEVGFKQAVMASQVISRKIPLKNPVVVSSSLRRALETAQIFVTEMNLKSPIIQEENIQERYYGDYSKAPRENPSSFVPDDAESDEDFQKRVSRALSKVLHQYPSEEKDLVVVSHQKVFQFLAAWLSHQHLKLEQGGVCQFKFVDGQYVPEIY
tara:strand:+ start:895 stop:1557 length:663 start_codon:yes stop_codon:yes gene_type:complete